MTAVAGDWLGFAAAVLVATMLLVVPGLLVSVTLGFRGLAAAAAAAPLSLGIVAIAALGAPLLGVSWSVVPVLGVTVVLVGVAAALRLTLRRHMQVVPASVRLPRWVTPTALAAGAVILSVQILLVIGEPGSISQSFDNVFHLNAARFILDTGSASPLTVGRMTSPTGALGFYPSGWHAFVSLIVSLSGTSIAIATTALILPAAAFGWVASVVLLTRTLFRANTPLILSAGVLSAGAASFPLLMIDYGVLYPYFLALTALPAVVAFSIRLLGLGVERPEPTLPLVLTGAVMLVGIAVAHPGALVAWLFVAMVSALWAWVRFLRQRPARNSLFVWTALLLVFAAGAFVAWRVLRPPLEARTWPTDRTIPQALGEVMFFGMHGASIAPILVLLFWTGVVVVWRSGRSAGYLALTLYGMFAVLYIASCALPWQRLRDLLTAAWYNNSPRLAALIPLFAIPIAAVGARWLIAWVAAAAARSALPPRRRVALLGGVAVIAVLATQWGGVADGINRASGMYVMDDDSPLLSEDEYALLEELPELVPADAVIAGSPWTGTALAYAVAGRDVLMRHILTDVSTAGEVVNDQLAESPAQDGALCQALEKTGVDFVLDFGSREVHGATHEFPGLEDLGESSNVRLVREVGDARLYQVTACGMTP